ncbi:unnamed protein product, partial [Rotaria sordida]
TNIVDYGTIIASSKVNYITTNDTINLIVKMPRTKEATFQGLTFVQP